MLEEIAIQLSDIEDIRETLAACLNFFTAQDVVWAQYAMRPIRTSALTANIEKVGERVNGYLGDYLIDKYESERAEEEPEEAEDTLVEDDDWLPDPNPLGSTVPKSRIARVVEDTSV